MVRRETAAVQLCKIGIYNSLLPQMGVLCPMTFYYYYLQKTTQPKENIDKLSVIGAVCWAPPNQLHQINDYIFIEISKVS